MSQPSSTRLSPDGMARHNLRRIERFRPVLKWLGAAIIIPAGIVASLIAMGTFDPKPYGTLVAVTQPGIYTLPERGEAIYPQSPPWPPEHPPRRFSVRLTAALSDGERDSGYGLAMGNGDVTLVVAASPLGYVAVWENTNGQQPVYHLPWQTWPHTRPGTEANEIWLDANQIGPTTEVTAWINRELLWRGELGAPVGDVGVWVGSFGQATEVDFTGLEWFAAED